MKPTPFSRLVFGLLTSIAISFAFPALSIGQDVANGLSKLLSAEANDYQKVIDAMVSDKDIGVDSVAKAIESGVNVAPGKRRQTKWRSGWAEWNAKDLAGVERPYQLYVPESVAKGADCTAVIVHMHGAVAKRDFGKGVGAPAAIGYAGMLWPKLADEQNFVVACPLGREDCVWWSDAGVAHVNAVVRDLKRTFVFPHEKIFGAGFSDGASGCYHRAMTAVDPFAGFIAMNGHPAVAASASGKQLYLPNMAMTATVAAMTHLDSLYPTKSVLPHVELAVEQNADVSIWAFPKMNHQPSYFSQQKTALIEFIEKNRNRRKDKIIWRSAELETANYQWLEILEFAQEESDSSTEAFNVMSTPGRVRFGVQFSRTKLGVVDQVVDGSAAASAGVKAGDRVVSFDQKKYAGQMDFRSRLRRKTYQDSFTCVVQRGSEKVELSGAFPEFVPSPIYRRELPTGVVTASLGEDKKSLTLNTTNIRKLRLWLPNDFEDQITITINEASTQMDVQKLGLGELLNRFAQTADVNRAQYKFIDVEIKD